MDQQRLDAMTDQLEFIGSYRGCEIFAKAVSGATQYIAVRAGGQAEITRHDSLLEVMRVIDRDGLAPAT